MNIRAKSHLVGIFCSTKPIGMELLFDYGTVGRRQYSEVCIYFGLHDNLKDLAIALVGGHCHKSRLKNLMIASLCLSIQFCSKCLLVITSCMNMKLSLRKLKKLC